MSENNTLNEQFEWHAQTDVMHEELPICILDRRGGIVADFVDCEYPLGDVQYNAVLMSKAPRMKALLERLITWNPLPLTDRMGMVLEEAKTILKEIEHETKEA